MSRNWIVWLPAILLSVVAGPQLAAAQETREPPVDSLRLRLLDRLERLARPTGADSTLFVTDSIREEEARLGISAPTRGDSISAMLLALPGYSFTAYQAEEASFDAQSRIFVLDRGDAAGGVSLTRGDITVRADTTIEYDEGQAIVRARGNPVVTNPQGEPLEAEALIYHVGDDFGSARAASTEYREGGTNWVVHGDMPHATADSLFLTHAHFTSCELEVPHYHFAMGDMKIVNESVLVGRDVRLYFADVPVFWLPFIAQSLAQGRQSGILTPRFSVNDVVRGSSGYKRRISNLGFYWAINDYLDAQTSVDWFSDNFVSLTGAAQYNLARQFLSGSLTARRYWGADGATKLAFDTRHDWEIDERTRIRMAGSFASDTDFVRQNSFDPTEVTQSIDSEGGASRRFDWGSLALSSNRRQYLSDDRTEWTLPAVNLSLSTITLFPAAANRAGLFNNLTWSGSASFSRSTERRLRGELFEVRNAPRDRMTGGVRHSLSIGRLSVRQNLDVTENATHEVPEAFLLLGDSVPESALLVGAPARSVNNAELRWTTGIDYQQQLIGSTTITPSVSISSNMVRSDTSTLAQGFVGAPLRASVGANLKTDFYGFGPGFGEFEMIRHKVSPSIEYQWSPGANPTALQRDVFGARALQPQNVIALTLNQTWEAKPREEDGEESAVAADSIAVEDTTAAGEGLEPAGDTTALDPGELEPDAVAAPAVAAPAPGRPGVGQEDDGPRRIQRTPPVNLLSLRTSVVRYDFVVADSLGSFLSGFETTRLSNQISSDFMRGLTVSVEHELFEELPEGRRFAPHLSQMNFGFGLGSESSLFQWLRRMLDGGAQAGASEPDAASPLDDRGASTESSVIPQATPRGFARPGSAGLAGRGRGGSGGWRVQLAYSLQRPRGTTVGDGFAAATAQMVTSDFSLKPTEKWDLSWRTSFDVERQAFNDHIIRLSRDLHRWEAHFDFLKTATGNWSFRFEVALLDNRDLKFDYEQRNPDAGYGRPRYR